MTGRIVAFGIGLAACLVLAACGLSEEARLERLRRQGAFEAELRGLLGRSVDEVVAGRGAPDKSFEFASGDWLFEWNDERVEETGGHTYYDPVRTYSRRTVKHADGSVSRYVEPHTTWVWRRAPIRRHVYECNVRLTTDARRIIQRWAYDGNGCY